MALQDDGFSDLSSLSGSDRDGDSAPKPAAEPTEDTVEANSSKAKSSKAKGKRKADAEANVETPTQPPAKKAKAATKAKAPPKPPKAAQKAKAAPAEKRTTRAAKQLEQFDAVETSLHSLQQDVPIGPSLPSSLFGRGHPMTRLSFVQTSDREWEFAFNRSMLQHLHSQARSAAFSGPN